MYFRMSTGERFFNTLIIIFLAILCFLMLYPIWNSVVIAFNDGRDTMAGGLTFWPRVFTTENMMFVLRDPRILNAFFISVARTIVGTFVGILVTSMMAYGLSKKELRFRHVYMTLAVLTMYFSGGLIPTFLVIRELGLRDNFMVYILPGALSVWNMIIFRSFFNSNPPSLEESATIDGAGRYRIFFSIILPISKPVFATLALFTAVWHWNSWFDAAIYVTNPNLLPIQAILRTILNTASLQELMASIGGSAAIALERTQVTSRAVTMATLVVATVPILVIYPFVQKYFVSGIMIGSLKE